MTDLPATRRRRVALTIAGSDSGGGAGIQADLKTFHAFGVFGTSAVTAITAQNTLGVSAVHPVPEAVVRAQIASVMEDLRPAAAKTGMLATVTLVECVAAAVEELGVSRLVVDPVMVATSGDRLLDVDAERRIVERLLPLALLVTPNLDEAELLCGFPVRTPDQMRQAGEALVARGAQAALIKGGHLPGDVVLDLLFHAGEWREWRRPRVQTTSTHGTGCTLSAAVSAGLALDLPLADAVESALDFVHHALKGAPGLGSGHGPLDHFTAPRISRS